VLIPLGWAFARTRDLRLFSAALLIALAAALTGRLTYAILHWEYFSERPAEVFSLAGLLEHGAILGGTAAYLALRRTVGNLAATCSAVFVLATVAASVGCVEAGCAYGREVFWQTDGEASLAWQLRVIGRTPIRCATRVGRPRFLCRSGWWPVGYCSDAIPPRRCCSALAWAILACSSCAPTRQRCSARCAYING